MSQISMKKQTHPTARRQLRKSAPATDRAWTDLEAALAQVLGDLDTDDFLVISHRTSQVFVQFAAQGRDGMRVEAVSNEYLEAGSQLSRRAIRAMRSAGWNAPTHDAATEDVTHPEAGSPNFYLDVEHPVPFLTVARLALRTVREIYGVRHPRQLQYDAFDDAGIQIRFPSLRLKRLPVVRTPAHVATLEPCPGEWKVLIDADESGAFVCDGDNNPVAYVDGHSAEETLGRALLIASAPVLRDAADAALRVLRAIAAHDTGPAAKTAGELVPALERAVASPSATLHAGTSVH
jgi:hypothetical protein